MSTSGGRQCITGEINRPHGLGRFVPFEVLCAILGHTKVEVAIEDVKTNALSLVSEVNKVSSITR